MHQFVGVSPQEQSNGKMQQGSLPADCIGVRFGTLFGLI
jgi:hypothetical protein